MNGLVLVVLGLAWGRLDLGRTARAFTFWLAVYGTYANWATTLLAALWGAGRMMPIASGTHQGTPTQEALITFGLWSLSLSMVAVSALVLWGLRSAARAE